MCIRWKPGRSHSCMWLKCRLLLALVFFLNDRGGGECKVVIYWMCVGLPGLHSYIPSRCVTEWSPGRNRRQLQVCPALTRLNVYRVNKRPIPPPHLYMGNYKWCVMVVVVVVQSGAGDGGGRLRLGCQPLTVRGKRCEKGWIFYPAFLCRAAKQELC